MDEVWLYGADTTTLPAPLPAAAFRGASRVVLATDLRLRFSDEPPSLRLLPALRPGTLDSASPASAVDCQGISITTVRLVYGFSAAGDALSDPLPSQPSPVSLPARQCRAAHLMATKRKRSSSPTAPDKAAGSSAEHAIYRSEELLDRQSKFIGLYSPTLPPKDLQKLAEKNTQLLANTLSFREQLYAKAQNDNMLRLNKSAVFITTLTLFYLPASFVSVSPKLRPLYMYNTDR